jgi:hypothetical protein
VGGRAGGVACPDRGSVRPGRATSAGAGALCGLLGNVSRKNGWQLAEHAGEATPDGMQRLLATADWDPDLVRDDLRGYVVEHLGDRQAVLVVDETGFLKKGTTSVGVQRQDSVRPGRSTTASWGSFSPTPAPEGGRSSTGSCTCPGSGPRIRPAAGPPGSRPRLSSGPSRSWPSSCWSAPWTPGFRPPGDRRRGPRRRPGAAARFLEDHGLSNVLAVKCTEPLRPAAGPVPATAAQLAAEVPVAQWVACRAGQGAKGRRLHDWTRVELAAPTAAGLARWLLIRRSRADRELAFYACSGPATTSLVGLVRVAGTRWAIEMVFPQLTKGWMGAVG